MHFHRTCLLLMAIAWVIPVPLWAQHCGPLTESYLEECTMKHREKNLLVRCTYHKVGVTHPAYQAYLVAFLHRDQERLLAEQTKPTIDLSKMLILNTKVIAENAEEQTYLYEASFSDAELIDKLKDWLATQDENPLKAPKSGAMVDFRLALYIPYLEDTEHSNLEGLPGERHECNYRDEKGLLFQPLPTLLRLQRTSSSSPRYWLEFNSDHRNR